MQLRPYQREAIDALDIHWRTRDDNPCIVLPTGSGKGVVIAELVRRYLSQYPAMRICMLVHVRELVKQNAEKLAEHWPGAPIGIYSASLDRRDTDAPVTFASIQSVYRRAAEFGHIDLVIVDEAHRIPVNHDRGQYRRLLADAKAVNPALRVLGLTATPFRLGSGLVCGPDNILNHVCYEANVRDLITEGYLSRLTCKGTQARTDMSGARVRGGEYVAADVEAAVEHDGLVERTVAEMVRRLAERKSWIVFCASVKHAGHVSEVLGHHGVEAPVIVGETPTDERERHIDAFARGALRALCTVNVLTEGFDVPRVDAIVLLRPTKSAGLFVQMVGRGFRLHPGKENCLVLDHSGLISEHGPIDLIRVREQRKRGQSVTESVPCRQCPDCDELVPISQNTCPACAYEWPAPEAKPQHDDTPDDADILSTPPVWMTVTKVGYRRHVGRKGIPSLRVDYHCGLQRITEYVHLEHDDYPGDKAEVWWKFRSGYDSAPDTVDLGVQYAHMLATPTRILVDYTAKYPRILNHEWPRTEADTAAEGGDARDTAKRDGHRDIAA